MYVCTHAPARAHIELYSARRTGCSVYRENKGCQRVRAPFDEYTERCKSFRRPIEREITRRARRPLSALYVAADFGSVCRRVMEKGLLILCDNGDS